MSNRLRDNIELLKLLKKAKTPSQRNAIIEVAGNDLVYAICECIQNVLEGNVRLTSKRKAELAVYVDVLRDLADRKTKVEQKKKILKQKGGFLPALLAPVVGIASGLIADLVSSAI